MDKEHIYIHHFSIMAPADVIDEVVSFYSKILEIKSGFRPGFGLPGHWLYSGAQPIIHLTTKDDRSKGVPGYFHHIALRCYGIDKVVEQLSKAKVEFRRLEQPDVEQTQLTVIDPAGNLVELNFSHRDALPT